MSLAAQVSALATAVGNKLRDAIIPRLLPAGGSAGQALVKTGNADYAAAWASVSGGGGASLKTTTTNIAPGKRGHITFTVADASASSGRAVLAQMLPNADWDADEIEGVAVTGTCNAGTIDFTITTNAPLVGNVLIGYLLS